MKKITKKQFAIVSGFCLLLGQAIAAGTQVHYMHIRAGYMENYIIYNIGTAGKGLLFAALLFPLILLLFEDQNSFCTDPMIKTEIRHRSARFFWAAWAIIFVCWLPYLLTFYPGGLVNDGIEAVKSALKPGFPNSSHWSPLYVLILKTFIHLGGLIFDSLGNCLYLYAVFESLFFSAVCAYLCDTLRIRFPQIRILFGLSIVLFALSGFFASYSMTFWADGIFGAVTVLFCIQLWDGVHEGRFNRSALLRLFIEELFLCLWRNNGVYIIAYVLLGMLILLKKAAVRPVITGLTAIVVVLLVTGPVYDKLGVLKDFTRESISIPLQQMAAVINSEYKLNSEQEEILYSLAPEEVWHSQYHPTLSDDIKFEVDQTYLDEHMGAFLKVWAQLLIPNIKLYVRAYLMQTVGFWKLNSFQGYYFDYWYGVENTNRYGLHEKDLFEQLTGISIRPYLEKNMRFISSGTAVWILLFSFCSILYQGKEQERLLILLPLLGCWLTVMVATPIAFSYRYVFPLAVLLPMVVLLPYYHPDKRGAWLQTRYGTDPVAGGTGNMNKAQMS